MFIQGFSKLICHFPILKDPRLTLLSKHQVVITQLFNERAPSCLTAFRPSKIHYPLHEAIENGEVKKVNELLKNEIIPVNEEDDKGNLPIVIAARNALQDPTYPLSIINVLLDNGACSLKKDGRGYTAFDYIDTLHIFSWKLEDTNILQRCLGQAIYGCGLEVRINCHQCQKECESYSAEKKAKVALEALSSSDIKEVAEKNEVNLRDVIKWRSQAREKALLTFFENGEI